MTASIANPHVVACEELMLTLDIPRIRSADVDTVDRLRELWQIDAQAYGDCSLEFEPFLEWWTAYPLGSRLIVDEQDKILASIGIYPLSTEQATAFSAGSIPESDLKPVPILECESGVQHWYASGIVVIPEHQNKGLLRTLLKLGIGAWQSTGHLAYPLNLYGLAEYKIGERLLTKFGFTKLRDGSEMPNSCDLYTVRIESASELRSLLQAKGV